MSSNHSTRKRRSIVPVIVGLVLVFSVVACCAIWIYARHISSDMTVASLLQARSIRGDITPDQNRVFLGRFIFLNNCADSILNDHLQGKISDRDFVNQTDYLDLEISTMRGYFLGSITAESLKAVELKSPFKYARKDVEKEFKAALDTLPRQLH